MLHAVEVLIVAGCLQAALAKRVWEHASYGGRLTNDAELQLEEKSRDETCHVRFGDTFHTVSQILVPLDFIWLALAVLLALAVILWMPYFGLHINESTGVRKLEATKWYRAGFASLTSHAAGIVGFVGFQKIVVARIVSVSDLCNWWSLDNLLLYTTLALSVVAMYASFVFLGVDYTRRLVIDAATQQGYRLMMKPKMLEHTGFGKAILSLAALMLLLYSLVIYEEVKKNTILEKWLLLDTVCGSATVVLFYINLRGLYRSPKVQFDTTSHSSNEDLTLEEFLEKHSNGNSQRQTSWATFLEWAAGEDLAVLATRGSRHALFPNQRFTPLLHAVCGLLLLGAFPIMVQFAAQSLFTDPELQELKALTGSLAELSPETWENATEAFDIWEFLKMKKSEKQQRFLFLTSEAATLQVTPVYRYTSSVEFCCPSVGDYHCDEQQLHHSVIKFFSKPLAITLPPRMFSNAAADCELNLYGLSSSSKTSVKVRVEPKKKHGLCDCSLVSCYCCGGYDVQLNFASLSSLDLSSSVKFLSNACSGLSCESINNSNGKNGNGCACDMGYVGNVSFNGARMTGSCSAAPCNFRGSNNQPGSGCKCGDGFAGEVEWRKSGWKGHCYPAKCEVSNSSGEGLACKCNDGFQGKITWNGHNGTGTCTPAPCNIENSTNQSGVSCQCADGFDGEIGWKGDIPRGSCKPAACSIANSTGEAGLKCRCADGFQGKITWYGPIATGTCTPAPCKIEDSNRHAGLSCKCADGFGGAIGWNADIHKGSCKPAACSIANSNRKRGWKCRCADGFKGKITWNGPNAMGACTPAPCRIKNSNKQPGIQCRCKKKFKGYFQWKGPKVFGVCVPAKCRGPELNGKPGPECRCLDGYAGEPAYKSISDPRVPKWKSRYSDSRFFEMGTCTPAECGIPNSIGKGLDCECADKFVGNITWKGSVPHGECVPAACNFPHSNKKPGLECACAYGYKEREPIYQLGQGNSDLFGICDPIPCVGDYSNHEAGPGCRCADGYNGTVQPATIVLQADRVMQADCVPAKCAVENAIGDGTECHCKDGYQGSVTWKGPYALGACRPARCSIQNSNGKPGLECKCLDGYDGSISWKGEIPSGTCTILPCRIPHSDFAEGPFCRCLQGFFGVIKWTGNKLDGKCLPIPKCSQNIIHASALVKNFDDDGNVCNAGEPFVLYGHECGHERIQWTSALSVERGRKWKGRNGEQSKKLLDKVETFLEGHITSYGVCTLAWKNTTCGRSPTDDSDDLGSFFTQPLPSQCSTKAAEPRCDSKIVYTVTNQEASQYSCPDALGNESGAEMGATLGTKLGMAQKGSVLQFTGQQCGYDLILWEFVDILSESFPPCRVTLSLSCGEIPHGEHLPRSCKKVGMPATFIASREGADESQKDGEADAMEDEASEKTLKYLVKFFQNSEYSIEGLENDTLSSSKTHTWWSAGWIGEEHSLLYSLPDNEEADWEKAPEAPDGSKFVEPDAGLHLATVGVVPVWWAFKFQDEVLRGYASVFDTDRLEGCFLHYFWNGTCYQIDVGVAAVISNKTESECPFPRGMEGEHYLYHRSMYGNQIYRSQHSCSSSLTASREFEFEIADVRFHDSSLTSASSIVVDKCRTVLRLAVDVNAKCHAIY